jgi:dihydrofolate synthase / folylpolyglutamate synthase
MYIQRAAAVNAKIIFAEDHYRVAQSNISGTNVMEVLRDDTVVFNDLTLPLQGNYQRQNLTGVLAIIEVLRAKGIAISREQLNRGLLHVVSNTNLKGRWQILSKAPLTICDTGHNLDGIRQVVKQILAQTYRELFMVIGMVKDKDISHILAELPKEARYYFCQAKIPRALPAADLHAAAHASGLHGSVIADVNEAIKEARRMAHTDDLIFIGGRTFVVAEIENL